MRAEGDEPTNLALMDSVSWCILRPEAIVGMMKLGGPLAGPVIACAVLDDDRLEARIADSKR